MYFEKNELFIEENIKDELVLELIKVSKEVFGGYIYIYADHHHHSGYDILNFENIDEDVYDLENLEYKFELCDISDGIYDFHPYEGLTLKEILVKANGRFSFE